MSILIFVMLIACTVLHCTVLYFLHFLFSYLILYLHLFVDKHHLFGASDQHFLYTL